MEVSVPVLGGSDRYRGFIIGIIAEIPPWFFIPARISRVVVSNAPEVRQMVAAFQHGTREIQVAPGVGTLLKRALFHEVGHGVDDGPEGPHRFSASPEWLAVHRAQTFFDLPKYRDDPREHFADMAAKGVLLGTKRLSLSAPREAFYLSTVVFPRLVQEAAAGGSP
jgi:hypothetical protein